MESTEEAKILLVDDEENILKALERFLFQYDYETTTANSAKEALEILENKSFDIIISDMRMPEMNGAAFLKIAAEKYPDTRRILLTGFAELDSAVSAINEGRIDFYLSKPWNEDQLASAIKSALEVKQLKEKNKSLMIKLAKANKNLSGKNEELTDEIEVKSEDLNRMSEETQNMHSSTIDILSNLIEMLEGKNKGLSKQVALISEATAQQMKLSNNDIETIRLSGLLHGIGKIGMGEAILCAPYDYLSPEQQKQYKEYPALGALALSTYGALTDVANNISMHREYYDGSGYPKQKKNGDILLGARIISCALDFCLLRRGLLKAKEMTLDQVREYIISKDNILYDSRVVEALLAVIPNLDLSIVSENEKSISSIDLAEGMVLSRDLMTDSNMMLVPKGQALNAAQIEKIKQVTPVAAYIKIDKE